MTQTIVARLRASAYWPRPAGPSARVATRLSRKRKANWTARNPSRRPPPRSSERDQELRLGQRDGLGMRRRRRRASRGPPARSVALTSAAAPAVDQQAASRGRVACRPGGAPRSTCADMLPRAAPMAGARRVGRQLADRAASAASSPGGARSPAPSTTMSGTPPTSVATAGRPPAAASISETGVPSLSEVSRAASLPAAILDRSRR